MSSSEAIVIVEAFGAAIKARSEMQLAAVYDDDITVWNNSSHMPMTKTESIAILGAVFRISARLEYVDVRRHLIDDGIVQQHRLIGTFTDGVAMPDLEACIIFRTARGRITRIDEYFDLSGYGPVFERISALPSA